VKEVLYVISIGNKTTVSLSTEAHPGIPAKEAVLTLMALQTAGVISEFRRMEMLRFIKANVDTNLRR